MTENIGSTGSEPGPGLVGPERLAEPFEPAATPSQRRFQVIYLTLRERITLLDYAPGTALDIDALAEEFGVSRTPMRSVLQQLAYHGLVVSRHGVRTAVAAVNFDTLREALQFRSRLAELIGVVTPKPPGAAAIDALREAERVCADLLDHPDYRSFGQVDVGIHEAICSLIGNRHLLQTYDDLYFRTVRAWFHFLPRLDWREEVELFQQDIAATRRAMEIGDVAAVGFVTRNAVSSVLIRLDALIRQTESAGAGHA
ncbi:GntR family transcriptional regulator [Nisaea sp.]|uniref:GntR family transcriptional regulator n=1 Tax=Nisaea sp. TaxID=2024842 RepID=UPI003B52CDF1